jgi:hypothetical protein
METITPRLMEMFNSCETSCDRACCGLDAFSFDPINLASYLFRTKGDLAKVEVEKIGADIRAWRASFGSGSSRENGYSSPVAELNWNFSPKAVDEFADRITHNLSVALQLMLESEERKFISRTEQEEAKRREDEEKAWRKEIRNNPKAKSIVSDIFNRIREKQNKK